MTEGVLGTRGGRLRPLHRARAADWIQLVALKRSETYVLSDEVKLEIPKPHRHYAAAKSNMGRSYSFECVRCGFRAKVSGGADRGLNFFVQTILCRDCKQLYDAVIRLRVPDEAREQRLWNGLCRPKSRLVQRPPATAPGFQTALNRLPYRGVRFFRWLDFKPQCPTSSFHRVEEWNERDKCPVCGIELERSALPYTIWD